MSKLTYVRRERIGQKHCKKCFAYWKERNMIGEKKKAINSHNTHECKAGKGKGEGKKGSKDTRKSFEKKGKGKGKW